MLFFFFFLLIITTTPAESLSIAFTSYEGAVKSTRIVKIPKTRAVTHRTAKGNNVLTIVGDGVLALK